MKRDDRLLLAVGAMAVTPMITTSTAALFAYSDEGNVLRIGAAGLGVGLVLMLVAGLVVWTVTE